MWLNEGFATWMETRITDAWRPEYAVHAEAVSDAQGVMDLDSLASARAVRQPVATVSDIDESFDGISYEKGAAVLAMIEHRLGETPSSAACATTSGGTPGRTRRLTICSARSIARRGAT